MTTPLRDVVAYILRTYPYKEEMSNARVTKLVYLTDWHHSLNHSEQATSINWYFDNYGPFVWDVKRAVDAEPTLFEVVNTINDYGERKALFKLLDENYEPSLPADVKASIDKVVESTKLLNWNGFMKFVYATFPIQTSSRYSYLDLIKKATEFRTAAKD